MIFFFTELAVSSLLTKTIIKDEIRFYSVALAILHISKICQLKMMSRSGFHCVWNRCARLLTVDMQTSKASIINWIMYEHRGV